ncbi:MAG: hypothetical protein IPK69_11385 [Phycisphaerales bacterium]|nr:MAG: hypothetical protein IPK69_11385 [Phycisphaerales bacterium]
MIPKPFHRFALVTLIAAAPAGAQVVLDAHLREHHVRELRLEGGVLHFLEHSNTPQTLPLSGVLALLPDRATSATQPEDSEWIQVGRDRIAPSGWIELTDGQHLPGRLEVANSKPETVSWRHPSLGVSSWSLESVSILAMQSDVLAKDVPPPSAGDVVLLTNGDRLEGFVASIGEMLTMDVGGQPLEIPATRVRVVRLANPGMPAKGTRLRLDDGTIVACTINAYDAGTLTITTAGSAEPKEISLREVVSVNLASERLVPLARHSGSMTGPVSRFWIPPMRVERDRAAPLGAADIHISGPGTASWLIPDATTRTSMIIELAPTSREYGDMTVRVLIDSREVASHHLTPESPRAEVQADLGESGNAKDRTFSITIEPGKAGPIQNEILVRRALLLE